MRVHNLLKSPKGVVSIVSCGDFGPKGRQSKGDYTHHTALNRMNLSDAGRANGCAISSGQFNLSNGNAVKQCSWGVSPTV